MGNAQSCVCTINIQDGEFGVTNTLINKEKEEKKTKEIKKRRRKEMFSFVTSQVSLLCISVAAGGLLVLQFVKYTVLTSGKA